MVAFGLTFYLIPKVLWVSQEKQLMKEINDRSSHNTAIPNFGGVAFFIVLVLMVLLFQSVKGNFTGNHLIIGMTLLFMVGLKDDLVVSSARVKLFGQISAALFLIFSPELKLTSLHGFLGIYEIAPLLGYSISLFLILAIVNSFNLIDGIDGLAATIGTVICLSFALTFYLSQNPYFVLISVTVAAILLGFLRFNLSRFKRKIFMGDSGSLVIGFTIACLTLKAMNVTDTSGLLIPNSLRISFIVSILFLPLYDTARVMLIRIILGNSPFEPDRNHLHHVLVDLGLSHRKSSFILGILSCFIIILFVVSAKYLTDYGTILLIIFLSIGLFILFGLLKNRHLLSAKPKNDFGLKSILKSLL